MTRWLALAALIVVFSATPAPAASSSPASYVALGPHRILDTRGSGNTLGPGAFVTLVVSPNAGAGVPTGATAVALNVTVTNTTAPSYLTVYPCGSPAPLASSLNWVAGENVPNFAIVQVGAGGAVCLRNQDGSADVVVDLEGYFGPAGPTGQVNANPSTLTANGTSTSIVTVTLMAPTGGPLVGDMVTFTVAPSSCGTYMSTGTQTATATTDGTGKATVTYKSSTTPGTCTITVAESAYGTQASIAITQTF